MYYRNAKKINERAGLFRLHVVRDGGIMYVDSLLFAVHILTHTQFSPSLKSTPQPPGTGRESRISNGTGRESRIPNGTGRESRIPHGTNRVSRIHHRTVRKRRIPHGTGRESRIHKGTGRESRTPHGTNREKAGFLTG
jgi:hypothetical protein